MKHAIAWLPVALAAGIACSPKKDTTPPSDPPQACTEEAMVCPDGSAVGRTGPNCEFAPCPEAATDPGGADVGDPGATGGDAPTACTRDAKVCPDGSAVGRTGPNCEFAPCPATTGG